MSIFKSRKNQSVKVRCVSCDSVFEGTTTDGFLFCPHCGARNTADDSKFKRHALAVEAFVRQIDDKAIIDKFEEFDGEKESCRFKLSFNIPNVDQVVYVWLNEYENRIELFCPIKSLDDILGVIQEKVPDFDVIDLLILAQSYSIDIGFTNNERVSSNKIILGNNIDPELLATYVLGCRDNASYFLSAIALEVADKNPDIPHHVEDCYLRDNIN